MSQTAIKIVALICMTIDHIGTFIPGSPFFFRVIGGLSAPLFLFCLVEGYNHTSNKRRYVFNFYLFGLVMAIINAAINSTYATYLTNNIFTAFFCILFLVYLVQSSKKSKWLWLVLYIASSTTITILFAIGPFRENKWLFQNQSLITAFTGNFFMAEGGILFILLGLMFFITRKNRLLLSAGYAVVEYAKYFSMRYLNDVVGNVLWAYFGDLSIATEKFNYFTTVLDFMGFPVQPFNHYYMSNSLLWLEFPLSLPFMLLYNGKRGKGFKHLFYWYYPLHFTLCGV